MAIRMHADAVLTMTDGFTGKPLKSTSVVVTRDGQPCSPVRKEGGVLVFVNTPPGERRIALRVPHFQPEELAVTVDGVSTATLSAILSPDRTYPLPAGAVRAWGTMRRGKEPLINARVLLGASPGTLKLAQDVAKAGDRAITLYAARGALRLPADVMLTGGDHSERVRLLSHEGELEAPLKYDHKRGETLIPVREVTTDGAGGYYVCLPQPGAAAFFCPSEGGWLTCRVELKTGDNIDKEIAFTK